MPHIRIWIHFVWTTKNREPVMKKEVRKIIFQHIRQNATAKGIYIDSIDGYLEHAHALISLNAGQTVDKIMQLLKGESSFWVNREKLIHGKFEWQDKYFAVSVSESKVPVVRRYINGQEEHHRKMTFQEEFLALLKKHRIAYDERYLWE